MHTDIFKEFFPDILSHETVLIKADSKDRKFFNNLIKVLAEEAGLFRRLATNEPLN